MPSYGLRRLVNLMDALESYQMELIVQDLTLCVHLLIHLDQEMENPMLLKQVTGLTIRLSSLLRMLTLTERARFKLQIKNTKYQL